MIALLFTAGIWRRSFAILLLGAWASLFDLDSALADPNALWISGLLLACTFIPVGESLSFGPKTVKWQMPAFVYWGVWLVLAISSLILNLPESIFAANFGMLIGFQIFLVVMALWTRTRLLIWIVLLITHLAMPIFIPNSELSFPVLLIYFFTFDSSWIPSVKARGENPIVFFDGVCGLCNGFVDFIILEDSRALIRFCPLQSEVANARFPNLPADSDAYQTILVQDGDKLYENSSAVVRVFAYLGGFWRPIGFMLQVIPVSIRDHVYRAVSRNRYRIFGKKDACRIPSAEERSRFLD